MTLDDYFASPQFRLFQDESLRDEAVRAADIIYQRNRPVKRSQLHVIPSIIQGAGLKELRGLADKQKKKNSDSKNKAFWTEIDALLSKTAMADMSLFGFLKSLLLQKGIIEDEDKGQDKLEQKRLRKRNNDIVDSMMERVLGVYFEHFNCHYFYKIQQGGAG